MRFVVSGGGTAGHIYPALAVSQELVARGHEVVFAGTPIGQEARIVPEAGSPFQAFAARGFNRAKPLSLVTSTLRLMASARSARRWLLELCPHAVAGFGGYVSVPVGVAARQAQAPLLVHEQNSAAGWANRFLAKRASVVALTYGAARAGLRCPHTSRVVVTGNPVRRELLALADPRQRDVARATFRASMGIPADALVLLVFGGSQGARSINNAVLDLAGQLLAVAGLHVLHIAGPSQLAAVEERLSRELGDEQRPRWHALGYCAQMGHAYVASDLAVARAGASSLAEIAALGVASLVVPYPYATDDHQSANARALVATGAAVCVSDADLSTAVFRDALVACLRDESQRARMAAAARALDAQGATDAVVSLLEGLASEARPQRP
ncbi:MAG: undecaprenyldiphospho-muramoylpentapeptide beta-N-acetylglucosaminyltransferase [Coriobacteriales bacterium]|jgi:UDP-N-acetylglucosamine--N-acetylmuramyl-(pentapeptide) pyrophosphoryl-undecaprenol N-acetylglucosamine transferase|nr:undecaprenyldiphospho-muramoylpentapeptide beta-N-acetylglucosaminyltransferase [Coriobacteriales bacterium]